MGVRLSRRGRTRAICIDRQFLVPHHRRRGGHHAGRASGRATERRHLVFEVLSLLDPVRSPHGARCGSAPPAWRLRRSISCGRPTGPELWPGRRDGFERPSPTAGTPYRVDPTFDRTARADPRSSAFAKALRRAIRGAGAALARHPRRPAAGRRRRADPAARCRGGGLGGPRDGGARAAARFEQFVLSVRFERSLGGPPYDSLLQVALRKLVARFTLCHVHADPLAGVRVVGAAFPCSPRSARVSSAATSPSGTLGRALPTPLDGPGEHPQWREHLLWFFPFAPGSAAMRLPEDVAAAEAVALNNSGLTLHDAGRWQEALGISTGRSN